VLQKATGSPETAGTQLHALFRDVGKREGFAGLGVVGIVQRLQADARLQKQLSDEGLAGFRRLAGNLPELRAAVVDAQRGQVTDLAGRTAALPGQVPEVAAAIEAQRASARAEAAATGLGVRGLRAEAAISGVQGRLEGGGRFGAFRRWMSGVSGRWTYALTGDEELAAQSAGSWTDERFGWGPGAAGRAEALLRDIKGNTARAASGKVPMPEY
jgi:hypothetical protein